MAQVAQFKIVQDGVSGWMSGSMLYIMAGLTLLTIAIVLIFPKISKAVPSSLVAIIIVSVLVYFLNIDTKSYRYCIRKRFITFFPYTGYSVYYRNTEDYISIFIDYGRSGTCGISTNAKHGRRNYQNKRRV